MGCVQYNCILMNQSIFQTFRQPPALSLSEKLSVLHSIADRFTVLKGTKNTSYAPCESFRTLRIVERCIPFQCTQFLYIFFMTLHVYIQNLDVRLLQILLTKLIGNGDATICISFFLHLVKYTPHKKSHIRVQILI